MKISKTIVYSAIAIPVIVVVIIGIGLGGNISAVSAEYDEFAQCLSNKGVKMYGAYWCPHCVEQKQMFGASWNYIDYVECSLPNKAGVTQTCKASGITSYPTWEFQNGFRVSGELPLEKISFYSGCRIE